MSLIDRLLLPGSARTRRCVLLALSLGWVSSERALAQNWSFRPLFTVGVGYDSNVVFTPGDLSPGDYFGGAGVRAPLSGRLSQNTSLSASYSANCEWYQDFQGLDACPSRQLATLGWNYAAGDKTSLGLGVGYNESHRPEEVLPEAGIDYIRGHTRNAIASANLSQRLGRQTTFGLGYGYGRPLYEPIDGLERRVQSHRADARLDRSLWRQGSASLRYSYQLYLREGLADDTSQVLSLGLSQGLGRNTTLSVAAEARRVSGEVEVRIRPQGDITFGHSWRSSSISLSYSRSRNYVVSIASFTETDSIVVSYSITLRKFRLNASGRYSRNRLEGEGDRTFETYRGSLNLVRMLTRWLGAGATYQYTWQRSLTLGFEPQQRHLGQVGFVITPWSTGPEGLR